MCPLHSVRNQYFLSSIGKLLMVATCCWRPLDSETAVKRHSCSARHFLSRMIPKCLAESCRIVRFFRSSISIGRACLVFVGQNTASFLPLNLESSFQANAFSANQCMNVFKVSGFSAWTSPLSCSPHATTLHADTFCVLLPQRQLKQLVENCFTSYFSSLACYIPKKQSRKYNEFTAHACVPLIKAGK